MSQVLLVDDDPLMRELLAEWLGEAGYRVRQADNGASALQMLSNTRGNTTAATSRERK